VVFKMDAHRLQRYIRAKGGLSETTFAKTLISHVPIRQIKHSWGAGGGWSKSLYLPCSVLHNCIMLGECCHLTNLNANHLKWIGQAW
jgi:hypothetical protein